MTDPTSRLLNPATKLPAKVLSVETSRRYFVAPVTEDQFASKVVVATLVEAFAVGAFGVVITVMVFELAQVGPGGQ